MKKLLIFGLILIAPQVFPQTPGVTKVKPIGQDCRTAIPLTLDNRLVYGVTAAPSGHGEIQEIPKGNHTFEQEHNSAWYLLSIRRDGEFVFDITPEDTTNDYDFLLYPYTDSNFCLDPGKNQLEPIRSNLSNARKSVRGITGLTISPDLHPSIGKGIGNPYSQSVDVKKGEKYMLVLDNVSPNGKGHTLEFNFLKEVEIKGIINDSDNKPISADIELFDASGNSVQNEKSNQNGEYAIKTFLKENQPYSLVFSSDSAFSQIRSVNTSSLKNSAVFPDLKVVLPKLKKGGKYPLGNINFQGNSAELLANSYPSVEALFKLMKKNRKLIIQIEGHVNDPYKMTLDTSNTYLNQALSTARALTIYNLLLKKGIQKERMTFLGLGHRFPINPTPRSDSEAIVNRRVEIKVISMD
ncbi:MAG TPA: OmpA family protein [Bacteroidia bacterium]|jgi:outer membrane protein OmpA-like peptidoglycan-associated protein